MNPVFIVDKMIIILNPFLEYDNVHSLDPDSQSHQQSLWAVKGRICEAAVIVWCSRDDGVCFTFLNLRQLLGKNKIQVS